MSTHSVCLRCPTGYIEVNNDKLSDFFLLPKLVPNGTTNVPYLRWLPIVLALLQAF